MREPRTLRRLPRSLDDVRGLRVARWIRESTAGQYDRYGPASQREQQDRFIERHGLVDTGLVFQVAHSGTTVWRSATMTEMLAGARAGAFDLLLAGYSDRWQRNLRRTLELLEDGLHPAGVALVMCDRRILSSDPQDWDELISEAAGAEKYSRRLSERITDGYAAKFDHHDDPGGHAGLGFRRSAEPPHTLEIDPERIPIAVGLFERYALGNVSAKDLAEETGLAESRIRMILMNPIYNGWVRRHRRTDHESRKPAPWRADPPVSDELWARVEEVRRAKTQGGGTHRWDRVDLLAGLLSCVCGRRLKSDGTFADGRHRKMHPAPCSEWGTQVRYGDETWEEPILAQMAGLELGDETIDAVVEALGSAPRPVKLDRARIDPHMRELALDHAAGRLPDAVYLERLRALRESKESLEVSTGGSVTADVALAWLRALSETWTDADVPEAKAEVLHAIYERITVTGRTIVSIRLTPAAYAHGLAVAMPTKVALARPTGVGRALATYEIPIEGRDEWVAAARRLA
jgi:DNA invertase Pin-like site-specific DNA recombinase